MLKLIAIACLTLAASPAFAGATPWQDLAPGVKARLISSDHLDGTTTLAGLEIDMPATTKTYWRLPGETGIPAQFDFSASSGISEPAIQWPYPEIDRSQGYLDYVYHGPIVLPVELNTTASASIIDVSVTLGICSDICVPAMAKFTLPLNFATPDSAQSIRLDQAIARTPILWDQPGQPFSTVEIGFDGSLHLRNPDPSIDPASVIADLGDPAVLFETPQKSPDGAIWTLKPLGGAAKKGLEGSSVQLTFLTPSGPYAVTRTIAPSAP
ncbi:MAG: protein-disulfide reductase DsbD domain-containing protein [Devosia sp.]